MAYNLTDYPFDQFQEMVKTCPTVILPIGLIEQHGHHLPLGTDIFNVTEPLRIGFDRINAFIAPGLHYCFSGGGIQGTMNVNPQLFGLMVSDICGEFVRMGFKNIIIQLGHGGTDNINALRSSLQMVLRRSDAMSDIAICLVTSSGLSETSAAIFKQDGVQCDFHAGMGETSRMLYWKPELVHMDRLVMDEPEIAKNLRSDQDWFEHREKPIDSPFVIERVTQREEVKIGVMGFPERASAEIGEKVCGEIIDGLVKLVDELNNRF